MIQTGNITIAYPKSAFAEQVAVRMQQRISTYHIPPDVRRKSHFSSLSDIREKWLIVCCTPESKTDEEILSLIEEYQKAGKRDHILTVLVSGTPAESFPESLLRQKLADGTEIEVEPLAANITAASEKESLRKLKTEALRVFAPMLGVSFDELYQRDYKRKLKIASYAGTIVILFSAGFLIYSLNRKSILNEQNTVLNSQYEIINRSKEEMLRQRNEAVKQNQLLMSRKASEAYDACDMQLALRFCLEGLDRNDPDSSADELKNTFDRILNACCASGYIPITAEKEYYDQYGNYRQYTGTPDEKYTIIEEPDFGFEVYSSDTGKRLLAKAVPHKDGERLTAYFHSLDDGRTLAVYLFSDSCEIFEIPSGKLVCDISADGSELSYCDISSDGILALQCDDRIKMFDTKTGAVIAEIPALKHLVSNIVNGRFCGKPGKYQLYQSDRFLNTTIMFEYHKDAIPVPKTMEEKIRFVSVHMPSVVLLQL